MKIVVLNFITQIIKENIIEKEKISQEELLNWGIKNVKNNLKDFI